MTGHDPLPKDKGARKLSQLELAFAHNNGIELLSDDDFIKNLEQGDLYAITDKWFNAFTEVHKKLFSSRNFNHDNEKPGIIWKSRGGAINRYLETLVIQLYDEHGFPRKSASRHELATYLADAYRSIVNENPYEHGEALAIRTFFALIGKTEALTDEHGTKLDINFTRLSPEEIAKLSVDPGKDEKLRAEIDGLFEKLLDPACTPHVQPLPYEQRWDTLPKSETVIENKHFLSHTHKNIRCLVALNGGLVPLDIVEGDLRQHIIRGKHPSTFKVSRDKIIDYLIKDGRETADSIDGIPTKDEIPLFPLNVDLLTGLDVTTQLPDVKAYCKQHNTHIMRLDKYIETHKDDLPDNLRQRLEHAAERIKQTQETVWKAVDKAFEGKTPIFKPLPGKDKILTEGEKAIKADLFMTMGGTGSGKSNLAGIASTQTDGNIVTASLDDSRTCFKAYDLYSAVGSDLPTTEESIKAGKPVRSGHHFGDYIAMETAASYIREGIVERAQGKEGNYEETPLSKTAEGGLNLYNLLYDGSGVPYKGRYDKTIASMKNNFRAHMLVADAPFEKAYKRAGQRLLGADGRAVPSKVIVDKHRGLPRAIRDAARDDNLTSFQIIDTDHDVKGEHYTLAYRCMLPQKKVNLLEKARRESEHNPRALYELLKSENLLPNDVKYAPSGWEDRMEFVIVSHNHHGEKFSDVIIITDAERMTAISRKGALNPKAAGKSDLYSAHQSFELREKAGIGR